MHVIEGLTITWSLENSVLHASICVSPWGNICLQLFFFRRGHPASILLPCGASPFRLSPAHSLPFILPHSFGLQWDRMPEAVLTALWTISHNWHHAIITSHQSNPCLPLLMSDSDPTRPARLHICHGCTNVHGWGKKKLSCGKAAFWIGSFTSWCSTAVNIKAFNLSNLCCLGGRSDSNPTWH